MTSNAERATALVDALRAGLERDWEALQRLLTDDVRAWTPALSTSSLRELIDELDRRDEAFSDIVLDVTPLDVGGDYACVEWTVEMTHTGTITVADDRRVEPSGVRVAVHGVTVAEFDGARICSVRQYWDEFAVLDQLGVPNDDE
jgi:ketosteroid isomerase-like protein